MSWEARPNFVRQKCLMRAKACLNETDESRCFLVTRTSLWPLPWAQGHLYLELKVCWVLADRTEHLFSKCELNGLSGCWVGPFDLPCDLDLVLNVTEICKLFGDPKGHKYCKIEPNSYRGRRVGMCFAKAKYGVWSNSETKVSHET